MLKNLDLIYHSIICILTMQIEHDIKSQLGAHFGEFLLLPDINCFNRSVSCCRKTVNKEFLYDIVQRYATKMTP